MNSQYLSFLFESNVDKIQQFIFTKPSTLNREENLIEIQWIPIDFQFKDSLLEMLSFFGVGCISFFIVYMINKWKRKRILKNNKYFYKN